MADVHVSATTQARTQDWFRDVLEFHRKLAPSRIGTTPKRPDLGTGVNSLTKTLVEEEFWELELAQANADLAGEADACIDLIYVLLGRLMSLGIDPRPLWDAVHAANMAKEGGETRADGKVLKPVGWTPPDIEGLLKIQGPIQ